MVIHRNTNYIKFIAAVETNANKRGDILEAWKDNYNNWHIFNPVEGKSYAAYTSTIRAIAGSVIEQCNRQFDINWRLQH